jgi:DNA replication protein DnaC
MGTDDSRRLYRMAPLREHAAALKARADRKTAEWEAERERKRRARLAAFTGDCAECFDEGECTRCVRGQAVIAVHQRERVDLALAEAGVPPRCLALTLDTYPERGHPALRAVRDYLASYDRRRGLILTGRYGTGKTGLLVGALRELAADGLGGFRFATGPDLLDMLRGGYDKGDATERLGRLRTCRLLAIDDLGAERPTEWTHERLFSIVNHRYEHQLPTWITTNCDMEGLSQRIGERSVWRLVETSEVVEVGGPNLRARGDGA